MEYLKGENNYYLIYDETKKETVISSSFVNDYVSKNFNVPMNICYSDEQGILAYIRPEHISYFIEHFVQKGIIDHNLEQYERLIQLKEDANPILFYHKFRE